MTRQAHKRRWSLGLGFGVVVAVSVAVGRSLWADMVITENDTQFEGDVLSDDRNMIILQTDRGIMYFARSKIKGAIYSEFPNSSAKVEEITGTAEYQRKNRPGEWRELVVGTKLRPGDLCRTGDNSKVIATVAGQGVLAVEPNSEITISEVRRNKEGEVRVRLALDAGQLWNDVGSLPSGRSRYTVETPQASCGVRGTVYSVVTDDEAEETTIATVEGSVFVVQKQEDGESLEVSANEQASLGETGAAQTAPIEAGFLGQWDGYRGRFQSLRRSMELEHFFGRFDEIFARVGLSGRQGVLASAGVAGVLILGLGVVIIRRR